MDRLIYGLSRSATLACVLALVFSRVLATSSASADPFVPSAEHHSEKHVELLDDLEGLWARGRAPDEGELDLYRRAASAPEVLLSSNCAYTIWDVGEGRDWVEARFDAQANPQWQLVSVAGSPPSDEQISKFKTRSLPPLRTARFIAQGEAVPQGVLTVLHTSPDFIFFGIKPHTLEDVPRAVRKMRPLITIVVSREDASVHIVDVKATKTHSLQFGMRISFRHHRPIYEYDGEVGAMVTKYRATKMRGRLFLIAAFNIDESQWYDNISCEFDDIDGAAE